MGPRPRCEVLSSLAKTASLDALVVFRSDASDLSSRLRCRYGWSHISSALCKDVKQHNHAEHCVIKAPLKKYPAVFLGARGERGC